MFSQFDQRLAALEEQHKDVVSRFQESHFQISCLRSEILELREENQSLREQISILTHNEILFGLYDNDFDTNIPVILSKYGNTFTFDSHTCNRDFGSPKNAKIYIDALMHVRGLQSFDFLHVFQVLQVDFGHGRSDILFEDRFSGDSFSGSELLSFFNSQSNQSGAPMYIIHLSNCTNMKIVNTLRRIKNKNGCFQLLFDACVIN